MDSVKIVIPQSKPIEAVALNAIPNFMLRSEASRITPKGIMTQSFNKTTVKVIYSWFVTKLNLKIKQIILICHSNKILIEEQIKTDI